MSQQRKKNAYPLVEVSWIDSASTPGWQRSATVDPLGCWSAGYLIHKDARSVVIALNCSSTDSENSFGDTMTIPAKCVKNIRKLR